MHIGDAVEFCKQTELTETYDVIIIDSSDPHGPAEGLFDKRFMMDVHRLLKPGGVMCQQVRERDTHTSVFIFYRIFFAMAHRKLEQYATAHFINDHVPIISHETHKHTQSQAETLWLDLELIKEMKENNTKAFLVAKYASMQVPTYPCGQLGAWLAIKSTGDATKDKAIDVVKTVRKVRIFEYFSRCFL